MRAPIVSLITSHLFPPILILRGDGRTSMSSKAAPRFQFENEDPNAANANLEVS